MSRRDRRAMADKVLIRCFDLIHKELPGHDPVAILILDPDGVVCFASPMPPEELAKFMREAADEIEKPLASLVKVDEDGERIKEH